MVETGSRKDFDISMSISRNSQEIFSGQTNSSKIVREFQELVDTLFNYRSFEDGAFLFTGTGIIPEDDFSLEPGDSIAIKIENIGQLDNMV